MGKGGGGKNPLSNTKIHSLNHPANFKWDISHYFLKKYIYLFEKKWTMAGLYIKTELCPTTCSYPPREPTPVTTMNRPGGQPAMPNAYRKPDCLL